MDDNDLPPFNASQERVYSHFCNEMFAEIEVLLRHIGYIKSLSTKLDKDEVDKLVRPWLR